MYLALITSVFAIHQQTLLISTNPATLSTSVIRSRCLTNTVPGTSPTLVVGHREAQEPPKKDLGLFQWSQWPLGLPQTHLWLQKPLTAHRAQHFWFFSWWPCAMWSPSRGFALSGGSSIVVMNSSVSKWCKNWIQQGWELRGDIGWANERDDEKKAQWAWPQRRRLCGEGWDLPSVPN